MYVRTECSPARKARICPGKLLLTLRSTPYADRRKTNPACKEYRKMMLRAASVIRSKVKSLGPEGT